MSRRAGAAPGSGWSPFPGGLARYLVEPCPAPGGCKTSKIVLAVRSQVCRGSPSPLKSIVDGLQRNGAYALLPSRTRARLPRRSYGLRLPSAAAVERHWLHSCMYAGHVCIDVSTHDDVAGVRAAFCLVR